jgi:ankyrin repeat protein
MKGFHTEKRKTGELMVRAASQGNLSIVQQLLGRGAVDTEWGTAIVQAAAGGHLPVVKLLLGTNPSFESYSEDLLRHAVKNGHEAMILLLLDFGFVIPMWALAIAVDEGHEAVIKLLLERNADLEINEDDLLYRAMNRGHEPIISLLLDFGLDVNSISTESRLIVLEKAVEEGHEFVVKLLLERNANLKINRDLIERAAAEGHDSVVSLLIEFCYGVEWPWLGGPLIIDGERRALYRLTKLGRSLTT